MTRHNTHEYRAYSFIPSFMCVGPLHLTFLLGLLVVLLRWIRLILVRVLSVRALQQGLAALGEERAGTARRQHNLPLFALLFLLFLLWPQTRMLFV